MLDAGVGYSEAGPLSSPAARPDRWAGVSGTHCIEQIELEVRRDLALGSTREHWHTKRDSIFHDLDDPGHRLSIGLGVTSHVSHDQDGAMGEAHGLEKPCECS